MTDMADAVTYADLRFDEIPLKVLTTSGELQENDADDGDVMYENFTGTKPPRVRPEPPAPPTGPAGPHRTGLWSRAPLLSLLLVLVSAMLLVSTIGLTVKYFNLSHQFHHLSVSHVELISNLTQRLQRMEKHSEASENRLETCWREKKDLGQDIKDLNTSLLESHQMAKKSTEEKEAAEERVKEAKSVIEEMGKGFCTENWKLFGNKCFFFSEFAATWEESKASCEGKESYLMVVQAGDAALKAFLAEKREDFWVGKELKGKYSNQEWKWPKSYDDKYSNPCWKLSKGNLMDARCEAKNKWICEKNLLMTSMKTETYGKRKYFSFSFTLWDLEYKCYHPY